MIVRSAKWVAGRVLRLIPEGARGRLLPGAFKYESGQLPDPVAPPATPIRLLIAPVNYAGQGWQWARAVERNIDDAGAVSMVVRVAADFRHPADQVVPLGFYAASRVWQRAQFEAVASGFTHVMVEAGRQPFGAVLDETTAGQVARLRARGVSVLMLCHGSDIRLPSRHLATEPDSPFGGALARDARVLEGIARRNRRMLDDLGLPVFVSTPGQLADVPYAEWLPVVVDDEPWRTDAPILTDDRPVVAHAPSRAAMKGSDLIDPILRRLDADGIVTYRRIEGVPFEQMPDEYRSADIVLDQFRLGDYGVAACEAMASGRIVIGHVSGSVRQHVRTATGRDLPIVQARAAEVEQVIRTIVADPDAFRERGHEGAAFVRAVHDGRRSADVLRPHLV